MIFDDENFYDYVYRLFYGFSHVKPEQAGLAFSKNNTYPILLPKSNNQTVILSLPRKIGDDYVFLGLLFANTDEGRQNLWALFLATLYHLAAHATMSDYSNYEEWKKNKTEDLSWLVIDFIEDIKIQKFIEHNDPEIWKNIYEIESKIEEYVTKLTKKNHNSKDPKMYHKNEDDKTLELVKSRILGCDDEDKKELVSIANFLYNNRHLLNHMLLPTREHHEATWSLRFENCAPTLDFFGIFKEQVVKLDELWQSDELAKARLLRRYKKHLKNLHFDNVTIPPGNLQGFTQIKSKTIPMLRRMRQQLRMVTNLTDDPRIDQIGYVDMQMAIQAIASEGQSNDIFEHDEPRRREEAWVVLVDKSASMNLRNHELLEFVVCIAESANELTGKHDAWALYSFDTNFQILKDFKEKYNQEVQARIGSIGNGGLSLLPDALEMANRMLNEDPREKKYIFLITDGHPSGYDKIREAFTKTVKKTDISDTTLISIGVSKRATRILRNNVRGRDLKTLVSKFITAYKTASSDM